MTQLSEALIQIGTDMRDQRLLREKLAGGTAGQVPKKVDGTDFNFVWGDAGGLTIVGVNADGSSSSVLETTFTLFDAAGAVALRHIGSGAYQLGRPAGSSTQVFVNGGIPMFSEYNAVFFNFPDSVVIDAFAFSPDRPVLLVQMGAGQLKIDGFNMRCLGLPITQGVNAALDVYPTSGAAIVRGDLAAADVGPYYTGLLETAAAAFVASGVVFDNFGMLNYGTSIATVPTRDFITTAKTYVELMASLWSGSAIGFARPGYAGELGSTADSIAIKASADLADIEVVEGGAVTATIAGAGPLGQFEDKWGVLVDTVAGEFWLIKAGTWVGPDPATDPGLPYFTGGDSGQGRFAVQAGPFTGGRIYCFPSAMTDAAAATAAGATQLGMVAP